MTVGAMLSARERERPRSERLETRAEDPYILVSHDVESAP